MGILYLDPWGCRVLGDRIAAAALALAGQQTLLGARGPRLRSLLNSSDVDPDPEVYDEGKPEFNQQF